MIGPRTLTNTSPKKVDAWQTYKCECAPRQVSLGKCKVEREWDASAHLLEQPRSRTLMAPNAGEDAEQLKLAHCWWECKNGTATLKHSLVASYKAKRNLITRSSNHL